MPRFGLYPTLRLGVSYTEKAIVFSVGYFPQNGEDLFPYASSPVLTFNQDVTPNVGNITLYTAGGSVVETFNVATGVGSEGGLITFSGNTVTINPNADLVVGNEYYLIVPSNVIQGVNGNFFEGVIDQTGWRFTASDLYLMTETGDYLLLENGDKIYMENFNG